MAFLLIAAMIAAMILLYATDRILKALARARRYRAMGERLDAAAARSEAQQKQRKSAATASAALTSVMPAINRPPLTLPGTTRPPQATAGCEATPARAADPGRERRRGRSGDKQARGGERTARGGDKKAHRGEGTAHPRPRSAERSGGAGPATGPRQVHPR
jgi:type II secretory pathway pseudopilin PulG